MLAAGRGLGRAREGEEQVDDTLARRQLDGDGGDEADHGGAAVEDLGVHGEADGGPELVVVVDAGDGAAAGEARRRAHGGDGEARAGLEGGGCRQGDEGSEHVGGRDDVSGGGARGTEISRQTWGRSRALILERIRMACEERSGIGCMDINIEIGAEDLSKGLCGCREGACRERYLGGGNGRSEQGIVRLQGRGMSAKIGGGNGPSGGHQSRPPISTFFCPTSGWASEILVSTAQSSTVISPCSAKPLAHLPALPFLPQAQLSSSIPYLPKSASPLTAKTAPSISDTFHIILFKPRNTDSSNVPVPKSCTSPVPLPSL
ncbi:unnamed protein product [Chondrus crispus]|uniref:Uncharacterized protein n=1 Tax=Chondrus crispus TaxID=2769 RepID=R7QND2_CHOCR|nr:unnamed protein product [Chondrus crispus]CDF39609.1 unnamed protein product [Chondrus crispus]|eukprot:XP_005709903.1 unnamed protein product [Chondrus crispus]